MMNFWASQQFPKKFTDFKPGDLLFFWRKAARAAPREGIVGYGRFQKAHTLSFRQMGTSRYGKREAGSEG